MSTRLTLIAALIAILSASTAQAQDAAPGAYTWTGIYIGGNVGYGSSATRSHNESGNPYSNPFAFTPIAVPVEKFSSDDAMAGGQIGYNYQIGSLVVGPEVSFSATAFEDTHPITAGAFLSPLTTNVSSKVDNVFTVTGRLGYLVRDGFLAYGKGGFASAEINAQGITPDPTSNYSAGGRTDGWTAGGGFEYILSKNISIAVEYTHLDFGDKALVGNLPAYVAFPVNLKVSSDADTVTARLNLHPFN